jgi:hypothetical protein
LTGFWYFHVSDKQPGLFGGKPVAGTRSDQTTRWPLQHFTGSPDAVCWEQAHTHTYTSWSSWSTSFTACITDHAVNELTSMKQCDLKKKTAKKIFFKCTQKSTLTILDSFILLRRTKLQAFYIEIFLFVYFDRALVLAPPSHMAHWWSDL